MEKMRSGIDVKNWASIQQQDRDKQSRSSFWIRMKKKRDRKKEMEAMASKLEQRKSAGGEDEN
ncbi:hypothetical protein SLEP1_g38478 [Rubroshorea leprosula]|nr:hypothetical protein SLEP1_g38478 [Rubroshorea leprosula]